MTAELALLRAHTAVYGRLTESAQSWDNRVAPYQGIGGWDYPYVVYFESAPPVDTKLRQGKYSRDVVMTIRCVSDTKQQSMEGGAKIVELFDDVGRNDSGAVAGASALTEGSDWYILSTTVEREVAFTEPVDDTTLIYHTGAMVRLVMERQ